MKMIFGSRMFLHPGWFFSVLLMTTATFVVVVNSLEMEAFVSQHGVKGSVTFSDVGNEDEISIRVNLTAEEKYAGEYSWGIYEFPIDYSLSDYCHSRMLGRRPKINLDDSLNKLVLPASEIQEFRTSEASLHGKKSIWGRSLVLEGPSRARICASIVPKVEGDKFITAEARFTFPVAGSVWLTSLKGRSDSVETKIFANLYHVEAGTKSSSHGWQLFITDILESHSQKQRNTCDFLQLLYDPGNRDGSGCSKENPEKCRDGDLTGKFGEVKVGKRESMFSKVYVTDLTLELPELGGPRSLFLVLYDKDHPGSFLACSEIREIREKIARAPFSHQGVTGNVTFEQKSPFHPVTTRINLQGLESRADGFHVHEFPVPEKMTKDDNPCSRTAGHFNPFGVDASLSPSKGSGTADKYEVGDLSGKYGGLKDLNKIDKEFIDPNLSLFGKRSIVGRSIVVHNTPIPHRWICTNIELVDREMMSAVVEFTYPIAGRIIFRQEVDAPFSDTSIFVESLIYSDGSKNDTDGHKWHVHRDIPGRDYYNWTGRCLSAGGHFNPYGISLDDSIYNECINEHNPFRCEVGDLVNKHKTLKVVGRKRNIKGTVMFFTDPNLPLSGNSAIIGRSIVIHDDNAPEHRGTRMACSAIRRLYRTKAVAQEWFGNGVPPPISGRLEFIQNSEKSITHSLVNLHGMSGEANSYHVHQVPVQPHLEFPCTGDAVGGHFNPWMIDPSASPRPGTGTPDQYEVGDLSGKYGLLSDMRDIRAIYNDSNLPLSGSESIIGRCIVVHKKYKGQRWACATIGPGFDPDEAKLIRAIASFHHPNGFAWGFIRFSQVVYNDGAKSGTTLEIRLKYPGKTNKAFTSGHNWSIYVSPVGHDAAIKYQNARCTAAGYRWNPTQIQLADPNDHGFYSEECGSDYPLRCEVGDMSGKNGKLSVGGKAYVVNDVNLPLEGDWWKSAIGKSIIIHGPNGSPERMACANIEKDTDIIKFATIRTKARFNLATFMEEVQSIMGIPEWFLFTDSRKTSVLHGGKCIQIELHFTGPYASKLEQDFTTLLRTGKLPMQSIMIPGFAPDPLRKTKLGYKECDSNSVNNNLSRTKSEYYGTGTHLEASMLSLLALVAAAFI